LASLITGVLQVATTSWSAVLWPTYVHMLVLGWLTQLIFGVALWMFPKRSADRSGRSHRLGWASYWLLNAGLLLRILGEPTRAIGGPTGWLLVAAALLQLAGGWAFVINTWPRVRER
jgi:hypothetical protein